MIFWKNSGFITGENDWKAIRRFSNKLTTVDKHHVFGAVSFHEIDFKRKTNYLEAFLNDAWGLTTQAYPHLTMKLSQGMKIREENSRADDSPVLSFSHPENTRKAKRRSRWWIQIFWHSNRSLSVDKLWRQSATWKVPEPLQLLYWEEFETWSFSQGKIWQKEP